MRAFLGSIATPGLRRNATLSATQALVSIASLFLAYRLLLWFAGREALGIWSLVGAYAVAIRLLDASGGSTVGRFVAVATQSRASPSAADYIDAGLVVLLTLYSSLAVLAWAPLVWMIEAQVPADKVPLALGILPLTLAGLVANVTSAASVDAFDGIGRADIRSFLMIGGYALMLVSGAFLIPTLGLKGLALAQVIQFTAVLAVSRLMLIRHVEDIQLFPRLPKLRVVRALFSYGWRIQLAGLANFLTDPLAKMLLAHFGGLSSVAIYELASKVVVQAKSLLVSAAMPLIPVFARAGPLSGDTAMTIIARGNAWLFPLVGTLIIGVNLAAPFVSLAMLGRIDGELILFVLLLAAGHGLNALSLFVYLYAQGSGKLGWNIAGQFSIGVTIIIGTLILAPNLKQAAIPASFAVGLAISSIIILGGNRRREGVNLAMFFPRAPIALAPIASILVSSTLVWYYLIRS